MSYSVQLEDRKKVHSNRKETVKLFLNEMILHIEDLWFCKTSKNNDLTEIVRQAISTQNEHYFCMLRHNSERSQQELDS